MSIKKKLHWTVETKGQQSWTSLKYPRNWLKVAPLGWLLALVIWNFRKMFINSWSTHLPKMKWFRWGSKSGSPQLSLRKCAWTAGWERSADLWNFASGVLVPLAGHLQKTKDDGANRKVRVQCWGSILQILISGYKHLTNIANLWWTLRTFDEG